MPIKPVNDAIIHANRISDSESMSSKLIYQIRTGQLNPTELDRLQVRCSAELQQLRSELDVLLTELRIIAEGRADRSVSRQLAA